MGALRFSPKQRQVLTWWREGSPHWEKSAIICDGAVRSGKTLCLGLSFFLWAMARFQGRRFALCGRSMEGVRRNLTGEVLPLLRGMGFQCREQLTRGEGTVSLGRRRNIFCLFGGGDAIQSGICRQRGPKKCAVRLASEPQSFDNTRGA